MHDSTSAQPRNPAKQQGFSLLEVLVAVFVLAVGIVSIAGLQFTAKRSNFEAIQRATATQLAADIVERMRANVSQLPVYNNNGAGTMLSGSPAGTIAPNCSAAACTAAELAAYDLWDFHRALVGVTEQSGGTNVGGLSLPRACIDGPAPSGAGNAVSGTYRVSIVWRGLTSLPSAAAVNACGFGAGITDYDDPETGDADVYRRILAIETYIDVLSAASAAPAPGT
jgi:type IV pilus assembly protein PilV